MRSSNCSDARIIPGVQIPHCAPPVEENAVCNACNFPLLVRPSMVSTLAPAACSTGTRQLFTSWPSINTEHAPHSPSPQPSLVPVRPHCSRSTSSRRSIGYALRWCATPLTRNSIATLDNTNLFGRQCEDQHFGHERDFVHLDAEGVFDGVQDGGRGTVDGQLADSFCAERAVCVRHLFEEDADTRNVDRGRHNVVGHLAVGHAPV